MKVTRIAYSHRLNPGKYAQLREQARRLGRVRSEVRQRYASVGGAALSDRQVRDAWLADRIHNQIVVRADKHHTRADTAGPLWPAVPGLVPRKMVKIPLNTTVAPAGTLRLILRGGKVEIHYRIDAAIMKISRKPCGDQTIGVDKGYTEALTDSDGEHHRQRTDRHRTRLPVPDSGPPHHRLAESETSERLTTC